MNLTDDATPPPDFSSVDTDASRPRGNVPVLVVASLLAIAALWLAKAILIPIVMGIFTSYALDPLQRRLVKWGVPRALGAALILSAVLAGCGATAYALRNQATAFAAEIPHLANQLKTQVDAYRRSGPGAVEQFQRAANDLQQAATAPIANSSGVTRVQIEAPLVQVTDLVWKGWVGALEVTGQSLLVVFLVYYLLAAGDLYKRKIVKIVGPSLSQKRVTVEILNEIDEQIESFLIARGIVSAIVGVSTALAFWALGMGQPIIWGFTAGVLNIIPYLGPAAVTLAAGLAAYIQFGTLSMALAVAAAATAVASLEGFVVTPWLMGRAGRMSAAAVFVGVSFWGWIWGVSGMLLAVPILMAVKTICDRVEGLQFISELLAD